MAWRSGGNVPQAAGDKRPLSKCPPPQARWPRIPRSVEGPVAPGREDDALPGGRAGSPHAYHKDALRRLGSLNTLRVSTAALLLSGAAGTLHRSLLRYKSHEGVWTHGESQEVAPIVTCVLFAGLASLADASPAASYGPDCQLLRMLLKHGGSRSVGAD